MIHEISSVRPTSYDKRVGLVLQGGGALGSYQAGVYEALAASEYLPDWVAGISVGAINFAIIAGNPPAEPRGRRRWCLRKSRGGVRSKTDPYTVAQATISLSGVMNSLGLTLVQAEDRTLARR